MHLLATSAKSVVVESLLPSPKVSLLARQIIFRAHFFPVGPRINLKPALKNLFTVLTSPLSTLAVFTFSFKSTKLAIPSSMKRLLVFVSDLRRLDTVCIPITLLSCVWKLLLLFWLFLLLLLLFLLLLLLAITLTALKPAIRKERNPNVLKPPDIMLCIIGKGTKKRESMVYGRKNILFSDASKKFCLHFTTIGTFFVYTKMFTYWVVL